MYRCCTELLALWHFVKVELCETTDINHTKRIVDLSQPDDFLHHLLPNGFWKFSVPHILWRTMTEKAGQQTMEAV